MKIQRYHSVGFAVLSSALALSSSNVIAGPSTASSGCVVEYVSDGDCDESNNTDECGFDGGDCCDCTCLSTSEHSCGENSGFACLDGSAYCFEDNGDSSSCLSDFISDGDCDLVNNTAECGFDGGDCCDCTCVSTATFTCGDPDHGGFACLDPSAYCVDDDDVTTLPTTTDFSDSATTSTAGTCLFGFVSDGDCDLANNTEECGYDGGDCCECTCISTDLFTCGDEDNGGFACLDPSAPCVDDDDFTGLPEDDSYFGYDDDNFSASYMFESCIEHFIGDGDCDSSNNREECGFDGGDCCECACVSTVEFTCGINGFDCTDPSPTCSVPSLVEAGTQTTVEVSANAYDTRPGLAGGDAGCGQDGCGPALTRDGVSDDGESRWSCSQSIVDSGKKCRIDFTFEEPQDIVDVQVAFWKGDDRSRTLEASINGEVLGRFDSEPGSTYTTLGVGITGVHTLTFKTVGLAEDEWISLNEVTFWTSPELQRR